MIRSCMVPEIYGARWVGQRDEKSDIKIKKTTLSIL